MGGHEAAVTLEGWEGASDEQYASLLISPLVRYL